METPDYIQLAWHGVSVFFFVVIGFVVARFAASTTEKVFARHLNKHRSMVFCRAVYYLVLMLFLVSALNQMGLQLSVVLGAAGVLSVAVGFASQTSMSNLISGLFLIWENPFSMGDTIRIDDVTGEVIAIDLLSVKLRTYDNLYVRIPNEKLIKSNVTTLTKFPIRRADLKLRVAYKEDIERVKTVLEEVAHHNPLALEEPAPVFIVLGFAESCIEIQFSVWTQREKFLELKNVIHQQIKTAFDTHQIEIPFPHLTLYPSTASAPRADPQEGPTIGQPNRTT